MRVFAVASEAITEADCRLPFCSTLKPVISLLWVSVRARYFLPPETISVPGCRVYVSIMDDSLVPSLRMV
ncbi:hypothetical protein D3C81_2321620 [compost metagenome]